MGLESATQQDMHGRPLFNTFGALSIAAGMFGTPAAVALRIGANVFGAVYTVACNQLLARIGKKQAVAA